MYLLTLSIGKFPTQLLKLVFRCNRLEKAIASTEFVSSWIVLPGNFPCGSVCFISVLNDIWDFPILIYICHLSKLICFTFGDLVQLWWLKFKVQWPYCRAGSSWTGSSIDPCLLLSVLLSLLLLHLVDASLSSPKPPRVHLFCRVWLGEGGCLLCLNIASRSSLLTLIQPAAVYDIFARWIWR